MFITYASRICLLFVSFGEIFVNVLNENFNLLEQYAHIILILLNRTYHLKYL